MEKTSPNLGENDSPQNREDRNKRARKVVKALTFCCCFFIGSTFIETGSSVVSISNLPADSCLIAIIFIVIGIVVSLFGIALGYTIVRKGRG